ncbi:MAG: hypothetical protein RMK89_11135 [Armatimonadota bacterium]|nr:hypothetical protein [Armatimonadota bacterium]MDW8144004.1 hypothetical protein [Armatimonadota bacterium]
MSGWFGIAFSWAGAKQRLRTFEVRDCPQSPLLVSKILCKFPDDCAQISELRFVGSSVRLSER